MEAPSSAAADPRETDCSCSSLLPADQEWCYSKALLSNRCQSSYIPYPARSELANIQTCIHPLARSPIPADLRSLEIRPGVPHYSNPVLHEAPEQTRFLQNPKRRLRVSECIYSSF